LGVCVFYRYGGPYRRPQHRQGSTRIKGQVCLF